MPRYTQLVSQEICDHLCRGSAYEELRESNIGRYPWMPQLNKWIRNYPEFASRYYEALQSGVLYMQDEIVSIADAPLPDDKELADRELRHRALKISARKSKIATYVKILTRKPVVNDDAQLQTDSEPSISIMNFSAISNSTDEDSDGD